MVQFDRFLLFYLVFFILNLAQAKIPLSITLTKDSFRFDSDYLKVTGWSLEDDGNRERYSEIMKGNFQAILGRHPHQVTISGTDSIYTFDDGIGFWTDFTVGRDELINDLLFISFMRTNLNNNFSSPFERMFSQIIGSTSFLSFILPAEDLDKNDLENLNKWASSFNYSIFFISKTTNTKHQKKYIILSGGLSGESLLNFVQNIKTESPIQFVKTLDKDLDFMARKAIPTGFMRMQTIRGGYEPEIDHMYFSDTSNEDTIIVSHEITHARFFRFLKRIKRVSEKRDYAIPYQVDGSAPFIDPVFGEINYLLNEVFAFTMSAGIKGDTDLSEILDILSFSYRNKVSPEAWSNFTSYWKLEKLQSRGSIPEHIWSEIKSLNSMDPEDVINYGAEAIQSNDRVRTINFLRLIARRKFPSARLLSALPLLNDLSSKPDFNSYSSEFQKVADRWDIDAPLPKVIVRATLETQSNTMENDVLNLDGKPITLQEFSKLPEQKRFTILWDSFLKGKTAGKELFNDSNYLKYTDKHHVAQLVKLIVGGSQNQQFSPIIEGFLAYFLLRNIFISNGILAVNKSVNELVRKPKLRDPFLEEFDLIMANELFSRGLKRNRLLLINLINEMTYPEELPRTYSLVRSFFNDSLNSPNEDLWLISMFFKSDRKNDDPASIGFGIYWGRKLIDDFFVNLKVQGEFNNLYFPLSNMFSFYQDIVSPYFNPGGQWGQNRKVRLDRKTRNTTDMKIASLRKNEKDFFEEVVSRLWLGLGGSVPSFSLASYYTILSEPMFLVALEDKLIEAILKAESGYSNIALNFLRVAGAEFLPKLNQTVKEIEKVHIIESKRNNEPIERNGAELESNAVRCTTILNGMG